MDSVREVIRFANLGMIKGGDPTDTDYETIRNKTMPRWLAYYQKVMDMGQQLKSPVMSLSVGFNYDQH